MIKYRLFVFICLVSVVSTVNAEKPDFTGAEGRAVLSTLVLHNEKYNDAVLFFHPEFHESMRSLAKILLKYIDYDDLEVGMDENIFNELQDWKLSKLMVKSLKSFHRDISGTAIVNEFEYKGIKYFALELTPTEGLNIEPFIKLIPMKEYEGEWYIYDKPLFDRFKLRIIKHFKNVNLTNGST